MQHGSRFLQTFKAPQPLDTPRILKIVQGLSGELIISISSLGRGALQYILRYGVILNGGHPESWTELTPYTGAKPPKSITGLTPGTTYAFQVRAFGVLGLTDWSDSVTRMCI